jgi:hypothetical protein
MLTRVVALGAGFGGLELTTILSADSCYVEFGHDLIGVDVDFPNGPKPTGTFLVTSLALVAEKKHFGWEIVGVGGWGLGLGRT